MQKQEILLQIYLELDFIYLSNQEGITSQFKLLFENLENIVQLKDLYIFHIIVVGRTRDN